MSSFAAQLGAAKAAHSVASALESAVRSQVVDAFDDLDKGILDAQTIRHRLEALVRSAYRSSAAVAAKHTSQESDLPGWSPSEEVFVTPYLTELLRDVRSNLRKYKHSDKTDADRRRAILRIQHSAGVAAQRGYTDSLVASYTELGDKGYILRKMWMTNNVNNVPCEHCRKLHGVEVPMDAEFPYPKHSKSTRVYQNLQGPPRHPRCQCYLVIFIVTLENAFEQPNIDFPAPIPAPESVSTDDVKSLTSRVFAAIIKALMAVASFVTGK